MRCIHRHERLEPPVLRELERRQILVNEGASAAAEWKKFAKTRVYGDFKGYLWREAGARERCYFCSDSLGVDVEHFFPKTTYPEKTFDPENLLLACSGCNRLKSSRFPLDAEGLPLLVNPILDDPWDIFFFNEVTGEVAARLREGAGGVALPNPRGVSTLDVLGGVLNRGAVAEGRRHCWQILLQEFGRLATNISNVTNLDVVTIAKLDDYGLLDWMLRREGAQVSDVRKTRMLNPAAWRSFELEWSVTRQHL